MMCSFFQNDSSNKCVKMDSMRMDMTFTWLWPIAIETFSSYVVKFTVFKFSLHVQNMKRTIPIEIGCILIDIRLWSGLQMKSIKIIINNDNSIFTKKQSSLLRPQQQLPFWCRQMATLLFVGYQIIIIFYYVSAWLCFLERYIRQISTL